MISAALYLSQANWKGHIFHQFACTARLQRAWTHVLGFGYNIIMYTGISMPLH